MPINLTVKPTELNPSSYYFLFFKNLSLKVFFSFLPGAVQSIRWLDWEDIFDVFKCGRNVRENRNAAAMTNCCRQPIRLFVCWLEKNFASESIFSFHGPLAEFRRSIRHLIDLTKWTRRKKNQILLLPIGNRWNWPNSLQIDSQMASRILPPQKMDPTSSSHLFPASV